MITSRFSSPLFFPPAPPRPRCRARDVSRHVDIQISQNFTTPVSTTALAAHSPPLKHSDFGHTGRHPRALFFSEQVLNPADCLLKEEPSLIGPYLFLTASTPKRSGTSRSLRTVAERADCICVALPMLWFPVSLTSKRWGTCLKSGGKGGREGGRREGRVLCLSSRRLSL